MTCSNCNGRSYITTEWSDKADEWAKENGIVVYYIDGGVATIQCQACKNECIEHTDE